MRSKDAGIPGESAGVTETWKAAIPLWPKRRFSFNEADTESTVQGRAQDRSRETNFPMLDGRMPSSRSQTDISTTEQRWTFKKFIQAPTRTPMTRGVG